MFRLKSVRVGLLAAFVPIACCFVAGCGGNKTYRVSGKVTFNGQPIPAGKIYFMPDSSKGNSGPTGYADIKDGEYDTSSRGGSGAVSGPVIISVEGVDPNAKAEPDKSDPSPEAMYKSLFPRYEITAELPSSSSTKDIEVPASAATAKPKQTGPVIVIP